MRNKMMKIWPLKLTPYKVQLTALKKADNKSGFAYFMEMGLGKTAVVLAEFLTLYHERKITTLVVICPNSVKQVWENEVNKMCAETVFITIWPEQLIHETLPMLFVMNYEATITMKGYGYLLNILKTRRCMLVLDESTNIKNPRARRTRVLIALGKEVYYKRILSGCPIAQGPHDLWAQLRFIDAITNMNYYVFRNIFCKMGGYLGKQVMGVRDDMVEKLNSMINKSGFRAKKDDWLDLPKKIFETRYVDMTPEQKKHYDNIKKHLITIINEEEISVEMVITQMIKLQQISSGFIINNEKKAIPILGGSRKLEIVKEILHEMSGKAIVSIVFTYTMSVLKFQLLDWNPATLEGGMTLFKIKEQIDKFKTDPTCRVLICQVQTGKYGHTFLGGEGDDRCATTIFYENSFALDDRIQMEERNHRIGQDRPVVYIDFVTSAISAIIVRALIRKLNVANMVIDGIKLGNL